MNFDAATDFTGTPSYLAVAVFARDVECLTASWVSN